MDSFQLVFTGRGVIYCGDDVHFESAGFGLTWCEVLGSLITPRRPHFSVINLDEKRISQHLWPVVQFVQTNWSNERHSHWRCSTRIGCKVQKLFTLFALRGEMWHNKTCVLPSNLLLWVDATLSNSLHMLMQPVTRRKALDNFTNLCVL